MACRKINHINESFVTKTIPLDNLPEGIVFPCCDAPNLEQQLNHLFIKYNINSYLKNAITQQYNEIKIYDKASSIERGILAPQLKIEYENYFNLPIIIYPYIEPLIYDGKVWQRSLEEMPFYVGWLIHENDIYLEEFFAFYESVKNFCSNFNLCFKDIMYNPSNIGYHDILGLRIIDYGLESLE